MYNHCSRGVNAMKYRNGDEAVDMEILPGGDGDEEKLPIGSNYVIVVTSSGVYVHLISCLCRNCHSHSV